LPFDGTEAEENQEDQENDRISEHDGEAKHNPISELVNGALSSPAVLLEGQLWRVAKRKLAVGRPYSMAFHSDPLL